MSKVDNGDMPAIEFSCDKFKSDLIHASKSFQSEGIYIRISSIHRELDVILNNDKAKKFAEWILDRLEKGNE